MTPNEYQKLAARTEAPAEKTPIAEGLKVIDIRITHALIGLTSETGELAGAVKKSFFYGKPLDLCNIGEECGDLLWYIALMLNAVDMTMEECMVRNIEKLKIRYPEKFTEALAADEARNLEAERKVLGK